MTLNFSFSLSASQAKRRKLGPLPVPVENLSLRDVVIVSRHADPCPLVATLRKAGFPVSIVTDTANPAVAISTQEAIVFTTPFAMTGLERKVLVYVPFQGREPLGREGREGVGAGALDDLKLSQALREMTAEDRVSLWYSASRCMSQLIILVP